MIMRLLAVLVVVALFAGCERKDRDKTSGQKNTEENWPTGLTPGPGTSPRDQARDHRGAEPSAESPPPATQAE